MNNSRNFSLILISLMLLGCNNVAPVQTYSVEELKESDALIEKVSKQCEMGEIPLDSANCENLKKAQLLRAW